MSAVKNRENTFKIDLSNFPKRPSFEEIHTFVRDKIGLKAEQIMRLQMNHSQNCAHIKCVDLKTALDVVDQHNEKHELQVNDRKIKVRLMMDDGGVEVKIHDLSENVSGEEIRDFLNHYGDVLSVKEVMWGDTFAFKGVSSGIRIVKMTLKKHIKSFVSIQGEQTLITYRNQPQTCRYCTNLAHPGVTCVQNKKLLGQKVDLDKRIKSAQNKTATEVSFAKVVSNQTSATSLMPRFTKKSNEQTLPLQPRELDTNNSRTPCATDILVPSPNDSTVQTTATAANDEERMDESDLPEPNTGDTEVQNKVGSKPNTNQSNTFKIPLVPINITELEISENESIESSTESDHSVQKSKRGKGRSKKIKLDLTPATTH